MRCLLKKIIPCMLLGVLSLSVAAQKPATLKTEGEKAFEDGRWAEALEQLSQYQSLKPGDLGVISKIGRAAYFLHLPDQAKQYLGYVTTQAKSNNPADWYYWARTLHGLGDWEPAIQAYKQFLRWAGNDHPLRSNAKDNILRCVSGMRTLPNEQIALIENLGNKINTAGDEIAPLPSVSHSNRLYFSAARLESVGGKRNDEGFEDNSKGHYCSDMYYSVRQTVGWDLPVSLSSLLNTSRFEVALDFTNQGKVLHFFRGFTLYSGEVYADTAGLKDEYKSASTPLNGPFSVFDGDQSPFYVNDSVVLFASRREGGYGGLDLWASRRLAEGWGPAINLGPTVNSPYDETTPFVAHDGLTLYFSTNRTEGMGGLDIWYSVFTPETRQWSAPVSMGAGLNSPGNDAWFRIHSDGNSASFASDRLTDNLGGYDLYYAYFKEQLPIDARAPFAFFEQIKAQDQDNKMAEVVLAPLFYTSDKDVLSESNMAALKNAANMAQRFPETKLLVTVHTDEASPLKFDLYAGIKRAEIVGKALISNGVAAERIVLRSAGPNFPIARNFVNGETNTVGQTLNRRIEMVPMTLSGTLPMQFKLERPVVSDLMVAAGTQRLDEQSIGLLYRVEMAVSRQVLTTDALGLFTDVLIESNMGDVYRYMAGAERSLAAANNIKKDVVAAGFPTATVVAYVNGVRLSKADAVGLVKKYPDLAGYIRG